ncbi:MAG: extracellular solute-binding protein [bacterium]
MSNAKLIIIGVVGVLVLIFVLMLIGIIPGLKSNQPNAAPASLVMWGVGNRAGQFDNAFQAFKQTYPNVQILYKGFDTQDEYESALIEAFASGNSPDIFMVANESFPRFANKIIPFSTAAITLTQLEQLFPQTVEQTFVRNGQAYALPLSIDTLALIYNKDMFNAASIPFPPKTWEEFKTISPRLLKNDKLTGALIAAPSPMGGSEKNVAYASDLLGTIMIQNGAKMVNSDFSNALFLSQEGRDAITFYTQFVDSPNSTSTWNDAMPYSIDAFSQEKTAMTFGYLSDVNTIRSKNSFLNFGVALLPQYEGTLAATHPFYYGLAVSIQTKNNDAAKRLILSLTTDQNIAEMYLKETKTPPALLSLINQDFNDLQLNVFARQALIARSWPKPDNRAVKDIFSQMIDNITSKKLSVYSGVRQAEGEVNTLFRNKSL